MLIALIPVIWFAVARRMHMMVATLYLGLEIALQ